MVVIQWTGGKHSGHNEQGVNIVVIQWAGGKHSGHTVDRG